jgi:hypothetical protein
MSTPPKDLFKRFETAPSPTHDAVQKWARHEGWTAPWDRKQQKSEAGKKSGHVRAAREKVRRNIVFILYGNLESAYRNQPFSTKSIKALHDEYLKVLHREKDNVLEAASNWFLAPFSMVLVQRLYDSDQKDNFLEAVSSRIIDCRKQRGWDRDPVPTNAPFTTWDEVRVPYFVQTCVDLHRLSETDLRFLSRVSRETLKKDLKSLFRGRQRTRRSR